MKNIFVKGVAPGCLVSLLFACNANTTESAAVVIDKEQIKNEIQAKEDSFTNLYNKAEMRNIGYYADDAKSFFQNRPPLVGKDSIIEFLKSDLLGNTDRLSCKTNEVFVSGDGNQVLEVGSFTVVDSAGSLLNTGNYMTLFEKRNGKYVAVRDMSASDSPDKQQ
jgi:ketosteroid isomerase-like protein